MAKDEIIIDGEKFIEINGRLFKLIPNDQPFSMSEEQKKEQAKRKLLYKNKIEYYMVTHRVGRLEAINAIDKEMMEKKNED